jgi:ribosome recycling factor
MAYDFKKVDTKLADAVTHFTGELASIRTGRAAPALLDSIRVEAYGSQMPLSQVGSIGNEDARTLRITLWDKNQIKDVEQAISEADLGVSVVSDDKGIRVIFPELTADRRTQLIKLAKAKLEEVRVSVRKARDESLKELEALEKEGGMGEDEKFRIKGDIQKRVDAANQKLDDLLARKEAEIAN